MDALKERATRRKERNAVSDIDKHLASFLRVFRSPWLTDRSLTRFMHYL